jgi:hypothetical protein
MREFLADQDWTTRADLSKPTGNILLITIKENAGKVTRARLDAPKAA